MGHQNNRKFYQIPFKRLLDKLKLKMKEYGIEVITVEESYTSKCDALAFEPIQRHNKYKGQRKKRGLFVSSANKLINADLNGAINIMRKYTERTNKPFKKVTGVNICNPEKVKLNISCDALKQASE